MNGGLEGWRVSRSQKAEVRRQKSEDRSQKTEDRRQKSGGLVTHPHCQTSENKGFPSLYTLYLLFVFNPKS